MGKAVKFVDVPITEDRDIPFEIGDRIVGITITNQGSNTILVGMGSGNAPKQVPANSSVSYGDVNGGSEVFYLVGNLNIESPAWDSSSVVLTYAYDVSHTQENEC